MLSVNNKYRINAQNFGKCIGKMKKSFFILCVIYITAISAIIRADFNYYDDMRRIAEGSSAWGFSRHLSNLLSVFLHGDTYLTDISPLTQLLAAVMMAAASALLLYIFRSSEEDKIGLWNIIAVLPAGICPYFLECYSYKFDAPYMALSVLVSVIPILFVNCGSLAYVTSVVLCSLTMCMTYQVSAGIFPLLIIFYSLHQWQKSVNIKNILLFIGKSAASYAGALLFFSVFIMKTENYYYANNELLPFQELIPGVITHLKAYYRLALNDFKMEWIVLIVIIIVSYAGFLLFYCRRNKLVTFLLLAVSGACSLMVAFGLHPAFDTSLTAPRTMYGIGIVIAMMTVKLSYFPKSLPVRLVCLGLSWCFFSFAFTYGNALKIQDEYTTYRINLVINDLNELKTAATDNITEISIEGNIGYSPIIESMPDDYDMLIRLVPETFGGELLWNQYYFFHFLDLRNVIEMDSAYPLNRDLPVLKDTMYHTIRGDQNYIVIELK